VLTIAIVPDIRQWSARSRIIASDAPICQPSRTARDISGRNTTSFALRVPPQSVFRPVHGATVRLAGSRSSPGGRRRRFDVSALGGSRRHPLAFASICRRRSSMVVRLFQQTHASICAERPQERSLSGRSQLASTSGGLRRPASALRKHLDIVYWMGMGRRANSVRTGDIFGRCADGQARTGC
jgi:hypothetical protein